MKKVKTHKASKVLGHDKQPPPRVVAKARLPEYRIPNFLPFYDSDGNKPIEGVR